MQIWRVIFSHAAERYVGYSSIDAKSESHLILLIVLTNQLAGRFNLVSIPTNNMSQSFQEGTPERAHLLPTKDTLKALKSDVTLESAILELCDNSLDAWKRSCNRTDPAHIDIEINEYDDRTELIIRDTAGGIPREDAAMLFALGRTAKDQVAGAIGTFGVGAKKSLVNLGLPFTVVSRDESADIGWKYRITDEWFENNEDWTVPVHETDEISQGSTEIRIEDLNYSWDEATAKELRRRLGEAYNLFLSDEMQDLHKTDYDLRIEVDGVAVSPEGMPEWSYSPFDGLHPRRYENIELAISEFDSPVELNITVGLLTKKSNQDAGTDIYCQKRKVASRLRGDEGGFGTGKDRLGNFSPRHQRLRVIVELETEGDGQALPWDTQKSSIDRHNPFMRGTDDCRGVYNWIRRTVQAYFDLDADRVFRAFLEPYDSDHPEAVNEGTPEVYDYSDRTQVTSVHRPDTDLPDVKSVSQKARSDALLWISCEEALEQWKVDAYKIQLGYESDRNLENLHNVSTTPPEEVEDHAHQIAGQISDLARIHYQNGIYYSDELEEWQIPRYKDYMDKKETNNINNVSYSPNGLPTTLAQLNNKQGENGSNGNSEPAVYTEKTLEDPSKESENAEIFLVLDGEGEEERGAKILDTTRKNLCNQLNLNKETPDEVLWEEFRDHFADIIK